MRFQGKVYREGHLWLAEVPLFEAVTRGRTRAEALELIADWFEAMIDRASFSVRVHPGGNREFEVSSPDLRSMISLLLQRRRKASGLSLAETARRLGVKSRNAYARYERGESLPTIEKLDRLLRAVSEGREVVVAESSSWTSSRQSHNASKHMSEPLKVSASRAIR